METLPSEINNFESRSKSVFDSLLLIEHNHREKESEYVNQTEEIVSQKDFELEKRIQSDSDSEFKIPCIDSYKRQLKNVPHSVTKQQKKDPDHIVNPDKWTKYSLEDVDASQMSASANFYAAMSLINGKNNEPNQDLQQTLGDIVYNKPIGANKMETSRDAYHQVGKFLLEKLSQEQEEIKDDLEKMDINESCTDQIHFKKKSKTRNIRVNRKSKEEDLDYNDHNSVEQLENFEKNSHDDNDDDFDEFGGYQNDSAEENEFGNDFEKF
ncbi:putative protein TSSC4-like [Brachionus plicatilis]|uniref:Uncharacterized protein n=1 Tax=Brachionus plicatilis TaxID=10195 RepID=A0A3M7RPZ1_BRAPC|nr:putative protein TSSC4-like [Brachionus plicatilis]